jgi:hypothetical protein
MMVLRDLKIQASRADALVKPNVEQALNQQMVGLQRKAAVLRDSRYQTEMKQQRAKLEQRLATNQQQQQMLAYEFPGLLGVEGVLGTTEADLTRARNGMGREFDKIRDQMAILRNDLQQDPKRALMMDAVVQQVLTAKNAAGKPEYTPQEQQRFRAWTEGQVESQRFASQMTATGGGLLFLGSLYPPIALTPLGHGLRVAATAATFGAAALEMPNLLTMHAAAQAQRGGSGEFTAQSPNEAQFNLTMGRVNLMLAAGDVLVETGALPAMLRGMRRLAARGVQVTRETWSAGMKAKQAGTFDQWLLGLPADQRQEMRAALEGVPTQRMEARTGNSTAGGRQNQGTATDVPAAAPRARTGARLSEELTDQQVENIVTRYPQWDNVKDFVGTRLDPNNLPPGYTGRPKNNPTELVRASTEGPYPPLTIENGIIMLQTGKTNRLSVFSRYKNNYLNWIEQTQGKAARVLAEQRLAAGNQLHHLVPDAVVRDNRLTQELMRRSRNYTLDRGTNILDMPQVYSRQTGEIVHLGSHDKFNNYVRRLLDKKVEALTQGGSRALDKVDVKALDKALRDVEDTLRDQIRNRTLPKELLQELEGGGFKISQETQETRGGNVA